MKPMLKAVPATTHLDVPTCRYPGCTRSVQQKTGPGAPPQHCDDPTHTPLTSYRRRAKLRAQAERDAARAARSAPSVRPVTDGTATLAGLVRRLEELRDEFAATLDEATTVAAIIADPDSLAREITETTRQADLRVAAAEQAAATAQHERDDVNALFAEAANAADEAIIERDAAAEQVVSLGADVQRIQTEAAAALQQMRQETVQTLRQMHDDLADATTARFRAEAERDVATAAVADERAQVEHVRTELNQQRTAFEQWLAEHARHLRGELDAVRANATDVRRNGQR